MRDEAPIKGDGFASAQDAHQRNLLWKAARG